MANVKYTNFARVAAWTPRVKRNFEGPRLACAIELFGTLDHAEREKALSRMNERHARLTEREAAK